MGSKRILEGLITFMLLLFLVTSIAGFILHRPILVSYAYSESMTPTINKGDLFFMNPLSKGGKVGDVIVFHRRDGWTVHRIFAVTEKGYLTKGDHNVAIDQENGAYPPVSKDKIAGKVLTLGDHPLVVRGGGDFINSVREKASSVYVIGLLLVAGIWFTFSGQEKGRPKRKNYRTLRLRMKTIYALVSVAIISGFLFVTVASWGSLGISYSSTLAGGQREGWYLPGTSFEKNVSVVNNALYPFYYFLEPNRKRVEVSVRELKIGGKLEGETTQNVLTRVSVPMDTRLYREEITVYSYPAILPFALIEAAYRVDPYLPLFLYSIELTILLFILYHVAGIGGDAIRVKIRRRSLIGKILGDG